ncbi:hypothetical protein FNV43_RR21600 [Rhamnella rubrinervis]|uniref:Reverse transcriptase zinc-binding domain-containing protein n=1 Tax=Rhamnella rubrinervis TaxID=2594499 RepID=A0A8K0GUC2_9ROSA|nr:hypothetical protein FNV43_RR21600 [Rhamnella rubrinervis]
MAKEERHCLLKTEPKEWSWEDQVANGGGFVPKLKLPQVNMEVRSVADLRLEDSSGWNEELISNIYEQESASTILKLDWSNAGVLPTREAIGARVGLTDQSCPVCGMETESGVHVFKNCNLIRHIAFGSKWGCRIDNRLPSNSCQIVKNCFTMDSEDRDVGFG